MLFFGAVVYGMPFILTLYTQQVLGYSAVKFGLTSVVFPIAAAVGSISGQAIVLRIGFGYRAASTPTASARSCSPRSPSTEPTSATCSSGCSCSAPGSASRS
jgi:hypothetical protein